jgi:hypothetical protein
MRDDEYGGAGGTVVNAVRFVRDESARGDLLD